MSNETKLIFEQLNNALTRLEQVTILPLGPEKFEIDLTIHRFEFTIELFWKALRKKLIDEHNITANSPKSVLQEAFANNLIDNEVMWIAMLQDRNLTSHTYKEALAVIVYNNIKNYTPFLRQSLNKLYQSC